MVRTVDRHPGPLARALAVDLDDLLDTTTTDRDGRGVHLAASDSDSPA